jgi:formylglycine-generating enzyme required for sulfatase activity
MKIYILIVSCAFCFSFSIRKNKTIIPPGTVQITETFFADETEISNFSWYEYEQWTEIKYGHYSQQHLATLPDTLVWRQANSYNEPYVKYYYRHTAYKNYPVVGISYEQAQAFCKWRTQRVKEFYYIKHKKELNIEYRLPTKDEWEMFSFPTSYSFKGKNEKGKPLINYVTEISDTLRTANVIGDNADVTAPVKSYTKNLFGLYNCFGNVAEMISEKGICKGGSWRNLFEECRPGNDITYEKPTAWLGFRCVCDIKK